MRDDKDNFIFRIVGSNRKLVKELNDSFARLGMVAESYLKIKNGEY